MELRIDHENSGLSDEKLAVYESALSHELDMVRAASKGMYETPYASINLSLDNSHLKQALDLAKKYEGCSLIVIVGIGGSNLGTMAIQEAILGKLHNVNPKKRPRVLYADTVDPASIFAINELLEAELKKSRNPKVLINLISKSGATTESIANFETLYSTLKKYRKAQSSKHVVVTTDYESHLWHFAKDQKFNILTLPKNVGGRYSVLSPVGLFPLAVLGLDIKKLMDGAAHMRSACLSEKHGHNPAIIRAAMIKNAYDKGMNIADNFYFKTDLESVGKWYRQLMGESIGKEFTKDGSRKINSGITPTVSIGSTDLHSMAQLYFAGPKNKFFTIVTTSHIKEGQNTAHNSKKIARPQSACEISVPNMHEYDALVQNIQQKKLSSIMDAISEGTMITMRNKGILHCRIHLLRCDEEEIGALLQLHMMEMIYLAALFDVNPFDQPNVEEYKIETKRILAKSRTAAKQ